MGHRGTLAERFSGRENSIGLIRVLLATAVVVAHARILGGFGTTEFGNGFSGMQVGLGRFAVYGFFVLSGFLITRSGMRATTGRFLWHRMLRILPGLWVCVLFVAFVVAPLLYWRQQGSIDGFWSHDEGPLEYAKANWWTGLRQYDVSGVLATAKKEGHAFDSGFDGALWSLAYEMACYLFVAVLAWAGILRRSRKILLPLTALLWGWMIQDLLDAPSWRGHQSLDGENIDVPILSEFVGPLFSQYLIYLTFLFCLGMLFQLYQERIPINDVLGVVSIVVMIASMRYGAFFVIGLPAFAYALMWLAVRLPRQCHVVGRKRDLSYGIYIYGFVVQQALVVLGHNRHGFAAYLGLSLVGTFVLAAVSWYAVEKQAMKLKDWTPGWFRPWPTDAAGAPVKDAPAEPAEAVEATPVSVSPTTPSTVSANRN
ncbi:acyltransferase [Streptomyces sp. SID3343]|uniref:acyltransferase family protein n=1 Tax=Streptomyces sp. SID3343 TaxID=2690260 RepID=UPI001367C74B|nr:acyltransferase [Streptomyces sp. SID3343]MYW01590.1 acyltransferase family protein [Streptomyces sp. SID3343]